MKKKRAIQSGTKQVSRAAGTLEVCSDCGHLRLRLLRWLRRSNRSLWFGEPGSDSPSEVEKCTRCRMPRLRLWRQISADEIGRVKVRGQYRSPAVQLLDAAKVNPAIRRPFVEVILKARPHLLSREPDIADRDLLAAIRVANQFGTDKMWKDLKERLEGLLLNKGEAYRYDREELRRCQVVLRTLARESHLDAGPYLRHLDEIKPSWETNAFREQKGQPGRQLGEMSQRVIAAVQFLKKCGERRVEETVSAALYNLGLGTMEPDT